MILIWYHSNGEQANRSINGKVTYIPMVADTETTSSDTMTADPKIVKQFESEVIVEGGLFKIAWNIAKKRYPAMNDKTDTFGMITNSIVERLIRLSKQ